MLSFAIFPVMVGLIATADDIFGLLIKPVWHPAVPLFRILCLMGLFSPLAVLFNNSMKARSNGSVIVRIEIVKKSVVTAILAATIPFGAVAIAWGQVGVALFDVCINFGANRRYSGYGWRMLAVDVLPVVVISAVMYASVWGVGELMANSGVGVRLAVEIAVGVASYIVLSWACRLPQWGEVVMALSDFRKRE
jgi:O-antigen/teichoic acid export membrane protein